MPPHLVFGAGGIGTTANSFTFTWDTPEKLDELLDLLKKLDILELDSASSYPPGNPENAETLLGQSKAAEKGFIIDSKIAMHKPGPKLDDTSISQSTARTLEQLDAQKVRTMYSHWPSKDTPLEETAAAFHRQYEAGKFERLGLCSYSVDDLTKYFAICEEKSYVKPSVYQGRYNPLDRAPEKELIPFLRKHNMAYYIYSPLAGGFLTGKVTQAVDAGDETALHRDRTRWRGKSTFDGYVKLYDKPAMHNAVRKLRAVCDEASPPLTLPEVTMRWLMHHSPLRDGDAIIFGAKTLQQIENNVAEARRGTLPAGPVLDAVEGLWDLVREK
ncbi:NADP-dependent oxidoreductase domain-containing protein [Apodospora peruviana]|uniref:NADP-dependent oxidoreductase domain-containing protein n=1 Tax=Apodospora peruviana TaxID=516989 RepID=A0AAE0M1H4_9PEZI|nr:NADP-dependent oxidoreductase domain-containing protein [Apodospora peruviana]